MSREVTAPTNCYGCHSRDDAHEGAFGRACEKCHDTHSFKQGLEQTMKSPRGAKAPMAAVPKAADPAGNGNSALCPALCPKTASRGRQRQLSGGDDCLSASLVGVCAFPDWQCGSTRRPCSGDLRACLGPQRSVAARHASGQLDVSHRAESLVRPEACREDPGRARGYRGDRQSGGQRRAIASWRAGWPSPRCFEASSGSRPTIAC